MRLGENTSPDTTLTAFSPTPLSTNILAAGYDICLVETVGVGQSETMVADIVDM